MSETNDQPEKKKKPLDLIGGAKKKSRSSAAKSPEKTPVDTPSVKNAKLADEGEKKEVLDLLSRSKKPKAQSAKATEVKVESSPKEAKAPKAPKSTAKEKASEAAVVVPGEKRVLSMKAPISVKDLVEQMGVKSFKLIRDLMKMDVFASVTTILDPEVAAKVCELYGFELECEKRERGAGVHKTLEVPVEPTAKPIEEEPESVLKLRTPIITVMGHVDHGKTSLLDYIRRSRVAAGEAGGITQHIGAYSVKHGDAELTFLDTPGHAIFTEMRARGADVTDIVVLVVAADDGIMPQTKEAIAHAKAAGKTIIVAINKCDLVGADPTRVKTELMNEDLMPVDFGGSVECVEVSAIKGTGVSDLLDLLVLQSEVLELKANPKANCRAAVIEARMEMGKGVSATVIVSAGTLKVGMPFICGPYAGKVRVLNDDHGKKAKQIKPGMPAEVIGFEQMPNVGDELVQMESERAAKKLAEERQMDERKMRLNAPRKSRMEDIRLMMGSGDSRQQLKLVLKGDVQGSVEAIKGAIADIKSAKVECVFVHAAVGPISESDILLASSSNAVILGFNVKVEPNAVRAAKREGVQVKLYSIVYELIDQVRDAMLGMLEPESRETIIGHAEVRQVFKLVKGRAAGSFVTDGKIARKAGARVLRDGQPVFDGKMSTLRRFQDEVDEVKAGLECGIRLGDFNEYEVGDIIECYTLEKIKQTL